MNSVCSCASASTFRLLSSVCFDSDAGGLVTPLYPSQLLTSPPPASISYTAGVACNCTLPADALPLVYASLPTQRCDVPVPPRLIALTALRVSPTKKIQKEGTLVTRAAQRWPPFVRMARRRGSTQATEWPPVSCVTVSYHLASGPLRCTGNTTRFCVRCYTYTGAATVAGVDAAGVDAAWRCVEPLSCSRAISNPLPPLPKRFPPSV